MKKYRSYYAQLRLVIVPKNANDNGHHVQFDNGLYQTNNAAEIKKIEAFIKRNPGKCFEDNSDGAVVLMSDKEKEAEIIRLRREVEKSKAEKPKKTEDTVAPKKSGKPDPEVPGNLDSEDDDAEIPGAASDAGTGTDDEPGF